MIMDSYEESLKAKSDEQKDMFKVAELMVVEGAR